MLNTYLAQTRRLLQNPPAPTTLYSDADLTAWINTARGQLAADGQCVIALGTLATAATTQSYAFSGINTGVSATTGIQGVINVQMITRAVSGGATMLTPQTWQTFNQNYIATTGISNAPPTQWAQYAQGSKGTIYLSPTPDAIYTLTLDCQCYPIDLVNDSTVEAIPFPWTDAVSYFAAYLALLSAQLVSRDQQADRMLVRYNEFRDRARRYATPGVLGQQYRQSGPLMPPLPGGVSGGR